LLLKKNKLAGGDWRLAIGYWGFAHVSSHVAVGGGVLRLVVGKI